MRVGLEGEHTKDPEECATETRLLSSGQSWTCPPRCATGHPKDQVRLPWDLQTPNQTRYLRVMRISRRSLREGVHSTKLAALQPARLQRCTTAGACLLLLEHAARHVA